MALITVADDTAENTIVVVGGANLHLTAEDIRGIAGFLRSADVLLMQLEVPTEAIAAAADIAHQSGRKVVLNAAPARELPDELLAEIDVLIVNAGEAAYLAGQPGDTDGAALAAALLARGPRAVVITLGPAGALLAEHETCRKIRTLDIHAVDTVGAGDAFCGSLAAMLAEGKSLIDAAKVGCAAGALAATKPGAIPSLPMRAAVREVLASS